MYAHSTRSIATTLHGQRTWNAAQARVLLCATQSLHKTQRIYRQVVYTMAMICISIHGAIPIRISLQVGAMIRVFYAKNQLQRHRQIGASTV